MNRFNQATVNQVTRELSKKTIFFTGASLPKMQSLNVAFAETEDFLTRLPDLVCLSHRRWDAIYQRPQHLLSCFAQKQRVFFIEEPVLEFTDSWWLEVSERECGVSVVVPHLPSWVSEDLVTAMHQSLMDELFEQYAIANPILWYYTPAALSFTSHLPSVAVVYDCMDELSAFEEASPALRALEQQLFQQADVVFTAGQSLYEAKQHQHSNIHAFPCSVDVEHFAASRTRMEDPIDQQDISHPRLGFYGGADERIDLSLLDLNLLDSIAQAKPNWQLVIIGSLAKVDPRSLPHHPNIHYLGSKSYQELPSYLAGWDVTVLPFAHNESTRFISPTKISEYLAAGKPVVSTSIPDVVHPYGEQGLIHIADTVMDFIAAVELAMQQPQRDTNWLSQPDAFLAQSSWNQTWVKMLQLVEAAIVNKSLQQNSAPAAFPRAGLKQL
jgi:UDP-galactopyranose mutase